MDSNSVKSRREEMQRGKVLLIAEFETLVNLGRLSLCILQCSVFAVNKWKQ